MVSQAEFQKINDYVIQPLRRHYSMDFDKEAIEDYAEDLARFSSETLKAAMAEVRRDVKFRPKPAHIFEACRQVEARTGHTRNYDGFSQYRENESMRPVNRVFSGT